jgi:hypothetical protein
MLLLWHLSNYNKLHLNKATYLNSSLKLAACQFLLLLVLFFSLQASNLNTVSHLPSHQ